MLYGHMAILSFVRIPRDAPSPTCIELSASQQPLRQGICPWRSWLMIFDRSELMVPKITIGKGLDRSGEMIVSRMMVHEIRVFSLDKSHI